MLKRYLWLLLLVFLGTATKAQVNYSFTTATGTYTSLVGTGTNPAITSPSPLNYSTTDEGYSNAIPIGFSFNYNGTSYTTVNANVNGYLSFGSGFTNDDNEDYYYDSLSGGPLSHPDVRPIVAPFWADMDIQAETNLTYKVNGTAPNRVFVIEWANALWNYTATSASVSCQVKLYETTNLIEFMYKQESGTPSGDKASIGLTAAGVGTGNFLSLSNASAAPTASTSVETKIFTRPATGQIYRFTPTTCLAPTNLAFSNITTTSATLSWTAATGASGYEYAVSATNTPPSGAGTATATTTVNLTGLTSGAVSYVFVRTNCGGGNYSPWVLKALVPCATNLTPANGAIDVPLPPTISWNPVAGATGYTIMFSADGGLTYTNLGSVNSTTTSTSIPGTIGSTTYYWYVRPEAGNDTASTICSSNAFSFTTIGGVPNDDMCNAIPLTLNGPSDCQTTETATTEANEPTYGCSTPNNTTWYTYTPTTDGPVVIVMSVNSAATTNLNAWVPIFTASGTCPTLTMTEAFPGTCDNADLTTVDSVEVTTSSLTAGTTYYIMVDGFSGAVGGYCIHIKDAAPLPPGPVNDSICNAIPLTLNGPSDCQTTETATTESNEPTFGCSTPNNTTWYTYTPTTSGPATIVMGLNSAALTNLDAWVSLFTASGSCPALTLTEAFPGTCDEADLTTVDSVEIVTNNLVAGTTYYIMVDGFSGAVGGYCIHIKDATPPPPAPVNDIICNAIPLTLNGPSDCQTTETATVDANEPTFGCSTPNNTTWYTYTPTVDGPVSVVMGLNSTATTNLNAWVTLFTASGTCPTLTLTEAFAGTCNQADLTTSDSVIINTASLTAGTTYYIMIDGFAGAVGGYCIHIKDAPVAPACTILLLPADMDTNVSVPAQLTWASVLGADGYDVALGTTNPPTTLGNTVDTTVSITGLAYNTTYYWTVYPTNAGVGATGCTVYSFTTGAPPPPPANDECTGSIDLSGGAPTPGTSISATQSLPADACNGFTGDANDDVWYVVTATNAGDLTVTETPDATLDGVMEAYTGTCGSLTQIACADAGVAGDPETISLTGLTPGEVVYIRVFDYGAAGSEGTFVIQASGTALPVKLVNFRGQRTGAKNMLYWSTASEQNNRGFEIQRSADGENFSALSFVQSKANNGNSSSELSYQFADEKPFNGSNYYRLKQTDFDGKVSFSNVVLIKGVRSTSIVMSAVYPNPVKDNLKVILAAPAIGTINLVVTDVAGKVVMQQSNSIASGDNNLSINVSKLPSGSYMIKAICANGCETAVSKFVKQ